MNPSFFLSPGKPGKLIWGAGPAIVKVVPPEREYDGRRCHVHFALAKTAVKYDIWVSPYADGRGAVQLGTGWVKSGELLTGLSPNFCSSLRA